MAEIVENCCATGALARASRQGTPDSDEDDEMLNKFWSPGVGGSNATEAIAVDLFGDEYMEPLKGKSHKKGPLNSQTNSGRSKRSQSSGFDDVCAAFNTYIQAKKKQSRARSTDIEAVSAGGDDYSLDACQDALLELGDIPPVQYIRELTLFKDREWAEVFYAYSCAYVPSYDPSVVVKGEVLARWRWDGSAHDNAVLVDSITRADLHFPHPPHGKYYLVDVGFTNLPRFLAPFRSQQYHLQEFCGRHYSGPKELFNHRRSSLHNVIERTFDVLKKRFPILRSMPNYKPTRQGPLVIACCVVHNWIHLYIAMDPFFMEADNEMVAKAAADRFVGGQVDYVDMSQHKLLYRSNLRDAIATAMWENHVGHRL
ncbi:uncharacterized protein LOC114272543 [Camellia sinensis]|uniref:uncharacterized protein LOC114272543 n=1 Tax=Camellia sinensis TaxID=4442 RepID=UPI0010365047|nr:uncharacterized protein LOC114272543 [Camellia sinensis]